MRNAASKDSIQEGAVVHVTRGSGYTGTVVRREGDDVYVAVHGSFVEDQVNIADVEPVESPTPEQAAWRGGVGIATPAGWVTKPVRLQDGGTR